MAGKAARLVPSCMCVRPALLESAKVVLERVFVFCDLCSGRILPCALLFGWFAQFWFMDRIVMDRIDFMPWQLALIWAHL